MLKRRYTENVNVCITPDMRSDMASYQEDHGYPSESVMMRSFIRRGLASPKAFIES